MFEETRLAPHILYEFAKATLELFIIVLEDSKLDTWRVEKSKDTI